MRLNEIEMIDFISKSNSTFDLLKKEWEEAIKKFRPYLLGTIGQFRIAVVDSRSKFVSVKRVVAYDLKANKYAAFLQLEKFSNNAYAETIISADKAYRGINLPLDMYSFLIKEEGMIIVSDEIQTIGARSIWEKLAHEQGIDVYGYNTKTKKVFQVDTDDLFNEDVYDDELRNELETLENELAEVSNDPNRTKQLRSEINNLRNQIRETKNFIRLFAARSK
jgi:hypothetical protein